MSESGFSGMVDHFGLADTKLILKSSSNDPHAKGVETASDENGNTIAQGLYIDGAGEAAECVYELQSSTLNLNTLSLGPTGSASEIVIESINVATNSGEWPQITVSGYIGITTDSGEDPAGDTFTLPSITISGTKTAQEMGFSGTGTDSKLQSSSLTAEGEIHFVRSDADTVGAVGFTGATVTNEGTVLLKDGADSISFTSPFEEVQALTSSGEMVGWSEGSFSGQGFLAAE
jgi:hypothetical protein